MEEALDLSLDRILNDDDDDETSDSIRTTTCNSEIIQQKLINCLQNA